MPVPTALIPWIELRFLDALGAPLSGGKVASYVAGTDTPKATYTENTLVTAHANPIILNADGRPPSPIFLSSGGYKFVVTDANDVPQYSIDNVGDVASSLTQELTGTVYTASLAANVTLVASTWTDLAVPIDVVPTTGTYVLVAQASFDNGMATISGRAEIRVNGVAVARGITGYNVGSQYAQVNITAIAALTAGDLVTLWVQTSSSWTVVAGATYTWLQYTQVA